MNATDVLGHISDEGLTFFGQMAASFTHDIKNILAVINENAGLLDDLLIMVNKGLPLDNGKVGTIAGKVKKQVERADGLVRIMNIFAHTHDQVMNQVNLIELIILQLELTRRLQAKHQVKVEFCPGSQQIVIITAPFFFLNLFWLCLEFAFTNKSDTQIIISTKPNHETKQVMLTFSGLNRQSFADRGPFPSGPAARLCSFLNAELEIVEDDGLLLLSLPVCLEQRTAY